MTFFVSKQLPTGSIRFGVSPRRRLEEIDDRSEFSTSPDGQFARQRQEPLFFAGSRTTPGATQMPKTRKGNRYLDALLTLPKPHLGIMAAGLFFVLLGFAVVINKGSQGWIEVVLGLAMIITPAVLIAQQRRIAREKEERERIEREEREQRNREMLTSFSAALERMQAEPSDATIASVRREREQLELPYELWSALARHAVLMIGFHSLRSPELTRLLSEASQAAGLTEDDAREVREGIVRTLLWHLFVDDRLGPQQSAALDELRGRLGVTTQDPATSEFALLRGITRETVPRHDCELRLGFHEYCIHNTGGLMLTNKRLLLPSQKPAEIALPKIDDLEVDADTNVLTIRADGLKKPLAMRLDDPIYTATLIDIALSLNEKPRSFS